MKTKLLIVLLIFVSKSLYAGNVSDYFPLKVGNSWVYTWYDVFHDPQRMRVSITKDTIINSKRYYNCYIPTMWQYPPWVRIDSLNGKIYALYNGGCQPNEILLDSLFSKKNDRIFQCGMDYRTCTDTGYAVIFGSTYDKKEFGPTIVLSAATRKYANGIGIYYIEEGDPYPTFYILSGCVIDGSVHGDTLLTAVKQKGITVPEGFSLSQNYPNPFNPSTIIRYSIPSNVNGQTSDVKLVVFDALGKEVNTLVNEKQNAGSYEIEFDGAEIPSGVYFYKLETDEFAETKRMILLK
ncbi:MAG: T9SS type A sorting domain-containing protein [Ignavibacteria bacterium]